MNLKLRRFIGGVIFAVILGISPIWVPISWGCIASAVITALIAITAFVILSRRKLLEKKTENSLMKPDYIPFLIVMIGNISYTNSRFYYTRKLPLLQEVTVDSVLLMQWICLFFLVVLAALSISEIRQRRQLP